MFAHGHWPFVEHMSVQRGVKLQHPLQAASIASFVLPDSCRAGDIWLVACCQIAVVWTIGVSIMYMYW
jgi:hypothetical protein